MKSRFRSRATPTSALDGARHWTPADSFALAVSLLIAAFTHARLLGLFFTPDDLIHLEQAAGILPTAVSPWRLLTQVGYFRLMLGLVGLHPLPYLLVNLVLHLGATALVFLGARRLDLPSSAAMFASIIFGAYSPALTVVSRAVGIDDLAALLCAALAIALHRGGGRGAGPSSAIAYSAGMLCKESILFLPLAIYLLPRDRRLASSHARSGAVWLMAPMLIFLTAFLILKHFSRAPSGQPYEMKLGLNVVRNLLNYAAWAGDLADPIPDLPAPHGAALTTLGGLLLAAWGAAASRPGRWSNAIRFGLAWWLLGLLPVLALRSNASASYAYVAMPGIAVGAAAALTSALSAVGRRMGRVPRGPSRVEARLGPLATAAVVAVALAYAARADVLTTRRVNLVVPGVDLPADPMLRGAVAASRTVASIGGMLPSDAVGIAIASPAGALTTVGARSGRTFGTGATRRGYDLVEAVTDSGRAIRLFYPQVLCVAFLRQWDPVYRDCEIYVEEGPQYFVRVGKGPRAHAAAATFFLERGMPRVASDWLAGALASYPGDSLLLATQARAESIRVEAGLADR